MPAPARNLTDTVVVVTGAAGGIGAAIIRQALEAGAKVVLGDLKEAPLREFQDEWGPERVACVAGDIRDEATSLALVQGGQESFGRVDSVVANTTREYGFVLFFKVWRVENSLFYIDVVKNVLDLRAVVAKGF